ncbi:hypothetical protein MRBBS_2478 [Marinobacter sp. BSs20148]|nr:hypothetical protein MRBBS_2478 [Marinobacter sp. BSs20148]
MRGSREPTRHSHASIGEITDHFTEGSVLSAYPVHIRHSQVFKPNDVIVQNASPLSRFCGVSNLGCRIWSVQCGAFNLECIILEIVAIT